MAGLDPRGTSEIIGRAFADAGAEVAVVPLAEGGAGFADAVAELDPAGELSRPGSLSDLSGSLRSGSSTLWLDLTGLEPHAWSDLMSVGPQELAALARIIGSRELVAIVRHGHQGATLTGLSGRVAERGRETGVDLAETLAANDAATAWLSSLGLDGATPGTGAADGVGSIILALGGRVLSGIDALIEGFNMVGTAARADLLVTGTPALDFHAVGGDVVKEVARLGTEALRPVIAIVGRNFVSSRELRLAGLESAHPILEGFGDADADPGQLAEVARRVARSWSW